ncbi:MAG: M3 family metallopeptidase [Bacteroidales bacterium]|nr:M3 family metallopeptidase [Bacteroidales bacterium]
MSKKIVLSASVLMILVLTNCRHEMSIADNPLLSEFDTPYGVPPFDKIKPKHFLPAFEYAIERHNKEIDSIVSNEEAPSFENTIVALDRSGRRVRDISYIFFSLKSANGTEGMQAISADFESTYTEHTDNMNLNSELFKRIESVYNSEEAGNLTTEEYSLLDKYYKQFVRNGVNLPDEEKEKLRDINQRLSELTVQFDQNLLKETNRYRLVIDDKSDLAGLSEDIIKTAALTADESSLNGKYVFSTHKPSMIPFLQYADNRELRKQLYEAYTLRGDNNNEYDNKQIIKEITNLRIEKAHLLGFSAYADYELDDRMAKTSENVYKVLNRVWEASLPVAVHEREQMQAIIDNEGKDFKLASYDWWYYAEKLRKQEYDLDENELKVYFELNNVRDGVFYVTGQLFGLTFEKIKTEIPKPHPDAEVYEVKDSDGAFQGILYLDYYTRSTKSQGAWCGIYRKQYIPDENDVRPVVTIVCNFSKPAGDNPVLLSLDETLTLFHEFGHGLHQLLSDVKYENISGSSVKRDFVELPSQIMENWAVQPDVLKVYAKHYKTQETMPEELIRKMQNSRYFNQGFATVEYVAASLLDMNYHSLEKPSEFDVNAFEKEYLSEIGLIPEIVPRYRSTYFKHIWSGGYQAGYYSYLWAEVLEKDAFEAFLEKGLFDQELARSFRTEILEKGGSDDPMKMYIRFTGREPDIEPLLRGRGLL